MDVDLSEQLAPGRSIAGWELVEPIGHGASGVVWRAFKPFRPDRHVAIKFVRAGPERLREIEILSEVRHPHVVPMLDLIPSRRGAPLGTEGIVLSMAEGDLQRSIRRSGPLGANGLRCVGMSIAAGLAYLHDDAGLRGRRLAHLDVKPANILRARRSWRLGDLGSASRISPDVVVRSGVTPAYAAPELRGQITLGTPAVGTAADIWSFGLTLVVASTGGLPAPAPLPLTGAARSALGPLADIVAACLEDQPRRRPTATQLFEEFDALERPDPAPGHEVVATHIERFRDFWGGWGEQALGVVVDANTSSRTCEQYFEEAAEVLLGSRRYDEAVALLTAAEWLNQRPRGDPMPGVRRLMRPAFCIRLRRRLPAEHQPPEDMWARPTPYEPADNSDSTLDAPVNERS